MCSGVRGGIAWRAMPHDGPLYGLVSPDGRQGRLAGTWSEPKRTWNNHDLQTENARAVQGWMERKYTNQDLYSWMVSQLSTLYF